MVHDVPGRYIVSRGRALESQKDALGSLDPALAERASTFLANARPEQALVTRCTDADLLVVGAGRPDRERDRPGVGAECAKEALCPVTVYRHPNTSQRHCCIERCHSTPTTSSSVDRSKSTPERLQTSGKSQTAPWASRRGRAQEIFGRTGGGTAQCNRAAASVQPGGHIAETPGNAMIGCGDNAPHNGEPIGLGGRDSSGGPSRFQDRHNARSPLRRC